MNGVISQFEGNANRWRHRVGSYSNYRPLTYWDESGYVPRPGYHPTDEEVAELIRLGHLPSGWKYTPA